MPFTKGNTIGQDTRFKTGQSGCPRRLHHTSHPAVLVQSAPIFA